MDEKKIEKLIVDGFKTQDKKIGSIKKAIEIDMVTQDDLGQKFEDHTSIMLKEMDRREASGHQKSNQILDELSDIRASLSSLNNRGNEEITDLYTRVDILEKEFKKLKKVRA